MRGFFVRLAVSLVLLVSGGAASAFAGDLIFTPVNPSFGGSPLNSNHLIGLANAQNEHKRKSDQSNALGNSLSSTERFLQMLQSRLYSSLAEQVSNSIFGPDAQQQGRIKFQDQEVSFINTGTEIRLAITDFTTGQITEIVVPTLITN